MADTFIGGDLWATRRPNPSKTEARRLTASLSTSCIAVLIAIVLGGLIMLMSGENPLTAYTAMVDGAFGSKFALGETLSRAAPLALVGYGAAVALRAGLITIGAQGQGCGRRHRGAVDRPVLRECAVGRGHSGRPPSVVPFSVWHGC